jgi:alternate signal-mediated exported protein, CPF_0494 family
MNRKMKLILAGLAIIALVGLTWAFFNTQSEIDNNLHTKEYGAETIEKFKPDQELEPGTEITKEVGVKNTGDYDLVVRIRLEEVWARNDVSFISLNSIADNGSFNETIVSAILDTDTGLATATQVDAEDGLVDGDESVMYKNLPGIESGKWVKGADGWFYYATTLKARDTTELLLASLKLAGNTDMGKYTNVQKYSQTEVVVIEALEAAYDEAREAYLEDASNKGAMDLASAALEDAYNWQTERPEDTDSITYQKMETKLADGAKGYAAADYTLTMVTQVCQATKEAVDTTWPAMDEGVKAIWGLQ